MLIRLLRTYLRPYRRPLLAVVVLQLVATIASLYLPTPERRHHRQGRRHRATPATSCPPACVMLLITVVQIVCSIDRRLLRRPDGDGLRPRRARRALFHQVGEFSAREVAHFGAPSLITRTTNDVQQVQMLVLMTCTMLVSAPIMCVGGIVMALRQDLGLSWLLVVSVPALLLSHRLDRPPDGAAVPAHAGAASTRSTGCCASRSSASASSGRSSASRTRRARFARRQRRADRHGAARRPADGADVPDRDAGAQRLERRRAVVRRRPGRRRSDADRLADGVPQLPDADPDVGHDGDLHGGA